MTTVYKLGLFVLVFGLILLMAWRLFRYLNIRIKNSQTGWQLFFYTLLLIAGNALIFTGGLFLLIYGYSFLVN